MRRAHETAPDGDRTPLDGPSGPVGGYLAAVRSRLTALALVSVLVVAACGSDDDSASPATTAAPAETDAPADTEPAGTEPEPTTEPATTEPAATDAPTTEAPAEIELAAFEPIEPGAYDVGVQTITIDADSERPLTLDVWFPIDDVGDAPLHQYTLLPGVFYESPSAVSATPDQLSADGPFPLVVYSHGSGGIRYVASDYTESIASHGYIVAAPDHTGNTAVDGFACTVTPFEVTAFNRPNDVIAVIDSLTDPTRPETAELVVGIDPEQIAVTGHSFGGFTTYAVASGYDNEIGAVEADPRVDALISLAPAVGGERPPSDDEADEGDGQGDEAPETDEAAGDPCADEEDDTAAADPIAEDADAARGNTLLSDERLASIDLPAMVIVGTDDISTPVVPNVTRVWELTASEPHYRVELVAGQHQSFTDVCAYLEVLPTVPQAVQDVIAPTIESQATEGCGPEIMPIERAQELTNTFAITFLDSVFRDGEMIDAAVTEIPDDVVFMAK